MYPLRDNHIYLGDLATHWSRDMPQHPAEAIEIIRDLVDKVVLIPAPNGDGLDAELYGDLATILDFCGSDPGKQKLPGSREPRSQLSVVAGAGFEPATFRL